MTEPQLVPEEISPLRAKILAQNDLRIVPITIDEWPDVEGLHLRTLPSDERSRYAESLKFDGAGNPTVLLNLEARLLVRAFCDADGKRIFTDEDVDLLSTKNSLALNKAWKVAADLNALTAKAALELEGN